jgi:hypothetical protein
MKLHKILKRCPNMPVLIFVTLFVALSLTTVAYSDRLPQAVPEEVGLSTQRLKNLDQTMQGYIDKGQLAGVVTLVAR